MQSGDQEIDNPEESIQTYTKQDYMVKKEHSKVVRQSLETTLMRDDVDEVMEIKVGMRDSGLEIIYDDTVFNDDDLATLNANDSYHL